MRNLFQKQRPLDDYILSSIRYTTEAIHSLYCNELWSYIYVNTLPIHFGAVEAGEW